MNLVKHSYCYIVCLLAFLFCAAFLTCPVGAISVDDVSGIQSNILLEFGLDEIMETNTMGAYEEDNNGCGVYTILNLIIMVLTYGIAIAGTIGLVISGIMYMSAKGNEAQVVKARRRIFEIVIGLVAYLILWTISQLLLPGGIMKSDDTCKQATVSKTESNTGLTIQRLGPAEETDDSDEDDEVANVVTAYGKGDPPPSESNKKGGSKKGSSSSSRYAIKNKKVLVVGDSIQTKEHGQFLVEMANSLGAKKVVNKSKGGATLAYEKDGPVNTNSVVYKIKKMGKEKLSKFDIILIAAGTNDWYKYSKVRDYNGLDNDISTTYGAVNYISKMVNEIRDERGTDTPRVVYFSPIDRFLNGGENPTPSKKADCNWVKNNYGKTLYDYREAVESGAYNNADAYISGYALVKESEAKSKKYLKDWLHPTKKFAKTIAKRAAVNYKLLIKDEYTYGYIDCYNPKCDSKMNCKCEWSGETYNW